MNEHVRKYLAELGARGGKAGRGAAKARKVTTEQARRAAQARWAKTRNLESQPS